MLERHLISGETLGANDFGAFYSARREALIQLIARQMGQEVTRDDQAPVEMPDYEDELEGPDPDEELAAELAEEAIAS